VLYQSLRTLTRFACGAAMLMASLSSVLAQAPDMPMPNQGVAVGAQYDTTHVYVAPDKVDAFVTSFVTTFGGHASAQALMSVLPTPSSTEFQALFTPVGNLSVFAYQTPIPFPFGQERTGYLVTSLDQGVKAAEKAGADVIVEPFADPIGRDAVIQWPGGVKMQLYWHIIAPSYAKLETIPENRVYVSQDRVDEFVRDFVRFAHGKVVSDDKQADAGEIGQPGERFRRVQIESQFGNMLVLVADGHLPFPFGWELTGYQVDDLNGTLAKATAAGAQVLSKPYQTGNRTTAIIEFPGGYIAEVHTLTAATHLP
jgi:predicted enzyme related to lactoylglutathione lyase